LHLKLIYIIQLLLQLQLTEGTLDRRVFRATLSKQRASDIV